MKAAEIHSDSHTSGIPVWFMSHMLCCAFIGDTKRQPIIASSSWHVKCKPHTEQFQLYYIYIYECMYVYVYTYIHTVPLIWSRAGHILVI